MASSGGIYGPNARPHVSEDQLLAVDSPLGFYLGTKLSAEFLFQSYCKLFVTGAILRPFFIYGPGQGTDMLIPRLIASVRDGRPIQLQGTDGLKMNPVFVEDAAAAFEAALDLQGFYVLNIAGPEVVSLRGLCECIGHHLGIAPCFEQVKGGASDYLASTTAADQMLGPALVGVDEGMRLTLSGNQS